MDRRIKLIIASQSLAKEVVWESFQVYILTMLAAADHKYKHTNRSILHIICCIWYFVCDVCCAF